MKYLRLEIFDKNDDLVFVREKPVFAQTQKGIRATHTRLLNWAKREFPELSRIHIEEVDHKLTARAGGT